MFNKLTSDLINKIIVELKNIEGRSHKEIADYLDISVTAAKVRLHRAHQKLRNIKQKNKLVL